jgi:uncharacterized protein (DUF1697 family)
MSRQAVLLRGINVGRNRRIAMADLRAALTEAGFTDVATLLNSGNVALSTDLPDAEVRPALETLIEKRFGFAVDVVLRSRAELARIVAHNPLGEVATHGSKYFVAFANEPITFDASIDGPDQWVVDGAEMYIWCPGGMRDSQLMKTLAKSKDSTVRNWNTVEKLLSLLAP